MDKKPHIGYRIFDALLLGVAVLLILRALEAGTTEVPMPCQAPPAGDTDLVIPFA